MDKEIFNDAVKTLKENDGIILFASDELSIDGKPIDAVHLADGNRIEFYTNRTSYFARNWQDWDVIELPDASQEKILRYMLYWF